MVQRLDRLIKMFKKEGASFITYAEFAAIKMKELKK